MKKTIFCGALLCFVFFVGCASTPNTTEMVGLRAKVNTLEKQVVKLQKQQDSLRGAVKSQAKQQQSVNRALSKFQTQRTTAKKPRFVGPSNKDMQTALKNAGYYMGPIDGKIGPKTRDAIMKFQGENDLKVDGVVGRSTWELLGAYL